MDTNKLRELLDQRDAIDAEIVSLVTGSKERKPIVCGRCKETGHNARACTAPEK